MTLHRVDGIVQPPIGRQQHWDLFRALKGSPLHEAIVAELRPHLSAQGIDSTVVGSKVLAAIEGRELSCSWCWMRMRWEGSSG